MVTATMRMMIGFICMIYSQKEAPTSGAITSRDNGLSHQIASSSEPAISCVMWLVAQVMASSG